VRRGRIAGSGGRTNGRVRLTDGSSRPTGGRTSMSGSRTDRRTNPRGSSTDAAYPYAYAYVLGNLVGPEIGRTARRLRPWLAIVIGRIHHRGIAETAQGRGRGEVIIDGSPDEHRIHRDIVRARAGIAGIEIAVARDAVRVGRIVPDDIILDDD